MLPPGEPSALGLREPKKARTRPTIQQHALRLFRERGYEATTVQEIAEAAEASESTFFRYFPAKEDVVLWDPFDPLYAQVSREQPPDLTVVHPGLIRRGAGRAHPPSVPSNANAWCSCCRSSRFTRCWSTS